jgi:hypothetical protein
MRGRFLRRLHRRLSTAAWRGVAKLAPLCVEPYVSPMKREINSTPNDVTNGSDLTQQYVIGYRALQAVIGGIAISLVLLVYFGNWLIFTHRVPACLVPGSHLPGSLSGFYYTHMRNVFVGAMSAMGVFLVAYKGYERRDTWFTNVAGAAAIGIALCPTTPPGGDVLKPTNPCGPVSPVAYHASKYASVLGHVHAAFLGILFAMVFFMLLLQFTKTTPGVYPELPKRRRNLLYRICAWAIFADALFVGVVTLVTHFEPSVWHGTSWLIYSEAFAFLAFGVAWFVKGRQGFGPFLRDTQ